MSLARKEFDEASPVARWDYVESLRDDLKKAADLLEEYARHDVTYSCLCCYRGHPYDHTEECAIGILLRRIEST